jgi:hypothetical protein
MVHEQASERPDRTFERSGAPPRAGDTARRALNNGVLEGFSTTPTITVEQLCGSADDVQMPVGHRVERPRTQGGQAHRSSRYRVRRLSP